MDICVRCGDLDRAYKLLKNPTLFPRAAPAAGRGRLDASELDKNASMSPADPQEVSSASRAASGATAAAIREDRAPEGLVDNARSTLVGAEGTMDAVRPAEVSGMGEPGGETLKGDKSSPGRRRRRTESSGFTVGAEAGVVDRENMVEPETMDEPAQGWRDDPDAGARATAGSTTLEDDISGVRGGRAKSGMKNRIEGSRESLPADGGGLKEDVDVRRGTVGRGDDGFIEAEGVVENQGSGFGEGRKQGDGGVMLVRPSVEAFTSVLTGFAGVGNKDRALAVFQQVMQKSCS